MCFLDAKILVCTEATFYAHFLGSAFSNKTLPNCLIQLSLPPFKTTEIITLTML